MLQLQKGDGENWNAGNAATKTVSMQGQIFRIISGACTVNLQWIRQGKNVSYVLTVPVDLRKGWNK